MALDPCDAVIVGSGAGGGIVAWVLARAGYSVVVLEKGPFLGDDSFSNDDVKFGYRDFYTQDVRIEPRTFRQTDQQTARINHVSPLSRCVGGGTYHYGAASFRFIPDMFRMASLYGVPPGSTLADWPLTYADLEPHYAAVEHAVGIAGIAPGWPAPTGYPGAAEQPPSNALAAGFGQHWSQPYPLPPVAQRYDGIAFRRATQALGLHPYPTPCAINTVEGWNGRHACVNCGFCNGWGCPNGAKGSTLTTVLRSALATGRCEIRSESNVIQVVLGGDGRARSVLYLDSNFAVHEQPAGLVVLACSTIDTPRLCLLSAQRGHPDGIGNGEGLVGRNLTTHHNPSAVVVITDGVHSWDTYRGAWNTIACDDFQDLSTVGGLPGGIVFPRGGVVTTSGNSPGYPAGTGGPISLAYSLLKPPGFHPGGGDSYAPAGHWGATFLQTMAQAWGTQAYILGVCEDLPRDENRVDLDPTVRDVYGQPVARVTYLNHPNDVAVGAYVAARMIAIGDEMLSAIGATGTVGVTAPTPTPVTSYAVGPRYVVHQHGTMRMGASPSTSVCDADGRIWGVPNLFVADGSLFPTSGGYNPTHTIEALAHRVATRIVEQGAGLLCRSTSTVTVTGGGASPNTGADGDGAGAAAGAMLAAAAAAAAARRSRRRPRIEAEQSVDTTR